VTVLCQDDGGAFREAGQGALQVFPVTAGSSADFKLVGDIELDWEFPSAVCRLDVKILEYGDDVSGRWSGEMRLGEIESNIVTIIDLLDLEEMEEDDVAGPTIPYHAREYCIDSNFVVIENPCSSNDDLTRVEPLLFDPDSKGITWGYDRLEAEVAGDSGSIFVDMEAVLLPVLKYVGSVDLGEVLFDNPVPIREEVALRDAGSTGREAISGTIDFLFTPRDEGLSTNMEGRLNLRRSN